MPGQAIVVADTDGVIRLWNAGAEALFGYDAPSAVGKSLDLIVPPEFREHHWKGFRAAMQGDQTAIDRVSANIPALSRSGAALRVTVRLLVLRDATQAIAGAMAIFIPDDGQAATLPRL